MFHLTQNLPLVPPQVTNQDGDLDIQKSQPLLFHQLTGLSHPLLDLLPDHLPSPTEILNHSSELHLCKLVQNLMMIQTNLELLKLDKVGLMETHLERLSLIPKLLQTIQYLTQVEPP